MSEESSTSAPPPVRSAQVVTQALAVREPSRRVRQATARPDEISPALRRSAAWQECNIHERRVLDHLIGQYQVGGDNGHLTALRLDLARTISARKISGAINRLEALGLIDIVRGTGIASRYALTWLPVGDAPPSDRWHSLVDENLEPEAV
jgi:hypothetical protein